MISTAQPDEFTLLSRHIAKKFLHTVIFVDEQAYFEKPEQAIQLKKKVGREARPDKATSSNDASTEQSHDLNAKEVMDTFASEGMVCTVLKPAAAEDPLGKAIEAAKRADAIILDWDIHKDDGGTALKIIRKIVEDDQEHCPRLRLILIYSGDPRIIKISEKVTTGLGSDYRREDIFTFTRGHLRIGIFSKEYARIPNAYKERVVPIKQLPDLLAREMAHITAGILSNVALESMSVLRNNTHMILGTFGQELDPAYLSHRALLPNPDDAMEHAVDLVASECRSVLETREVGKTASMNFISGYLKERLGDTTEVDLRLGSKSAKLKCSDLVDIQEKGLVNSAWLDKFVKKVHGGLESRKIPDTKLDYEKKAYKNLTEVFTIEGEDPATSDNKYAAVSSFKRRNGLFLKNPVLTQGTILKEEPDSEGHEAPANSVDKYYLCIQPRCDCVRVDSERNFLFLPLRAKDNASKFDFVIELESGNFMRLQIVNTTYELTSYKFQINGGTEGLIRAVAENGEYYFYSNGKKFRWIAELKNDQSQRVVNNFAAKISRVGTDDFEWLRRSQSSA